MPVQDSHSDHAAVEAGQRRQPSWKRVSVGARKRETLDVCRLCGSKSFQILGLLSNFKKAVEPHVIPVLVIFRPILRSVSYMKCAAHKALPEDVELVRTFHVEMSNRSLQVVRQFLSSFGSSPVPGNLRHLHLAANENAKTNT